MEEYLLTVVNFKMTFLAIQVIFTFKFHESARFRKIKFNMPQDLGLQVWGNYASLVGMKVLPSAWLCQSVYLSPNRQTTTPEMAVRKSEPHEYWALKEYASGLSLSFLHSSWLCRDPFSFFNHKTNYPTPITLVKRIFAHNIFKANWADIYGTDWDHIETLNVIWTRRSSSLPFAFDDSTKSLL